MLAVEKRLTSPLLEQSSVEKIMEVDSHIAAAISGLTADARTLVEHARVEAANHRFTYDEPMRAESLAQSICDLAMSFGEGGDENKSKMSRPFGVSLLIAGVDATGTHLFHADPRCVGGAVGAGGRLGGRAGGRPAGRGRSACRRQGGAPAGAATAMACRGGRERQRLPEVVGTGRAVTRVRSAGRLATNVRRRCAAAAEPCGGGCVV